MEKANEVHEAFEHTSLGVDNRKLGIWVFLASETLFFGALIATYLVSAGRATSGPKPTDVLSIPLVSVNTFVLITSSLAMVTALSRAQAGQTRLAIRWLYATGILGLLFLGGQAYEFYHLYTDNVTMGGNLFGASFFTLTGTHGMHVFSGIIWILLVIFQLRQGRGTKQHQALMVELAGLYWHFVDLVWIIIFTMVYLLQ